MRRRGSAPAPRRASSCAAGDSGRSSGFVRSPGRWCADPEYPSRRSGSAPVSVAGQTRVRLPCRERFRHFVNTANHAAQFPHPQVQLHVHQRPYRRIRVHIVTPKSDGSQCAEGTQAQLRVPNTGARQAASQALQHRIDRGRLGAVQHPQEVHEGGVLAQLLAKRETPFPRFKPPDRRFPEEHLVLRPNVRVGRGVSARVHPLRKSRLRHEVGADDGVVEKLVDPLAHLADHGVGCERLVKHLRHVVDDGGPVFVAADGGGRADADKLVRLEPRPQPPDETGEIRPLRAVEGVQLIHHQVAQHARDVVAPQREVDGPRQQQVEHLVVGEQNVRRPFAQDLPVLDDVVRSHALPGRCSGLAHVQSRRHLAVERRCSVDDPGDSPRLIRGQRVHGIDDDGLDAGRTGLGTAVVEHRVEEALGLSGAGSGRDDRRLPPRQPVEGVALVAPGREAERRFRERLAHLPGRAGTAGRRRGTAP